MLIRNFIITFVVFFCIDLVWLGIVAKNLYSKMIGYIMSPKPNWYAAIVFYVIFIIGLMFFALYPALEKDKVIYALLYGMFFGFVTYSTYDLTNLATLKDWPILITVIDLAWGTFLGGATTTLSYLAIKFLETR
ncbi:MAG: DUF2177 family protein [Vallitaleaceae bacterium]|nr:DUF2177 family protein [Vallitaleaceae bacterium]